MSSQPILSIIINGNAVIHNKGEMGLAAHLFEPGQELLGEITGQKPEITYNRSRTYKNGKKAPDGIEIRFGTARPTAATREILRSHGFKFSEKQTIWYAIENERSKSLAEQWEDNNIEVDTTQYVKQHFWARVKSSKEYGRFYNRTEFQIRFENPVYFYTKSGLEKSHTIDDLIDSGLLFFKKYYNIELDENGEAKEWEGRETEDEQMPDDLLELEAKAELELLKLRLEIERKKRNDSMGSLNGIGHARLDYLRSKARVLNEQQVIPDFK